MATADEGSTLTKVARYTLIGVNVVTFLGGLILFIVGIVLQVGYSEYLEFLGKSYFNSAIVCIILGVVICVISFLGLYGSLREDYCTLLSFSILLSISVCVELSLGIAAFALAKEDRLSASLAGKMQRALDQYGEPEHEGITKLWDILQTDLDCCGVEMPGDWSRSRWARLNGRRRRQTTSTLLPDSCCLSLPVDATCSISSDERHTIGCIQALENTAKSRSGVLGAIVIIIGLIQICLVLAACNVMKNTKHPGSKPPFF